MPIQREQLIPHRVLVFPKSSKFGGRPYYVTKYRRFKAQSNSSLDDEIKIIGSDEFQGDLNKIYESWSRFGGDKEDRFLLPVIALQHILFQNYQGILAIEKNRIIGVASFDKDKDDVIISPSPVDIDTERGSFIRQILSNTVNKYFGSIQKADEDDKSEFSQFLDSVVFV